MENVSLTPAPPHVSCHVSLRIFSQARRVSQRAKGAWIYVIDARGNRYAPEPDPSAAPLDVLLRPGESITTSRVFKVPADSGALGLIAGHGGPGCFPGCFIIGADSSLFHQRTSSGFRSVNPVTSRSKGRGQWIRLIRCNSL